VADALNLQKRAKIGGRLHAFADHGHMAHARAAIFLALLPPEVENSPFTFLCSSLFFLE
jgi:hypothetical protein